MFVHTSVVLTFLALISTSDPPAAGTLILRNSRWERLQVEMRMGMAADCPANPVVGTRTLKRGQGWTVVSSAVVCWRREVEPGNASRGWTTWTSRQVAANAKQEVDL